MQLKNIKIMSLFKLLLLLFLVSVFICNCNAQSADPTFHFCNEDLKIKNNTKVSNNIGSLLSELVSSINARDGFSVASQGKDGDQVYGLAQCRGDLSANDCLTCIQDASKQIRNLCPDQADARIWYDYCFLRYDIRKFYGQLDTSLGIIYYNVRNVTNPDTFNKELGTLIDKIRSEAVLPGKKSFATGKSKVSSPFVTLYALVQCTRDLSQLSCAQCLATAISNFNTACSNKEGCRVFYSSCSVRYEIYPFFFPLDPQEKLVKTEMKDYSSVGFGI